jgi:SWI/SNF chromatin-remodeling complex subunit SWI1
MNSWMNEAAVPNHNGNGFQQHMGDPSGAATGVMMDPSNFMSVGNAAQFNPQFANLNSQQIAAMQQNGQMRNASPSFPNPMYQTNQVIPSKRPRPREDSLGQSPRQAPGMVPTSRADTPQQATFPGFQQPGMAQPSSGQPSPFPHLQPNGSTNATPSPIMANQMRPGSVPQRVSTASPHPFSPAAQQFPQASPIASEHAGTPQPNQFMQQNSFAPGFNQQFNPSQSPARPSPTPNPMANPMMAQQMGQIPPQQMAQMQAQMQGQMQGQMAGQMAGQMPQMPGQMPNQMFPQGMPQARNALEQQQLMYKMQLSQQMARNNMQMPGQNMAQQAQLQAQAQAQALSQAQAQVQAQNRNMMAARQGMANGQMAPNAMRPQQGIPQQQQGVPRGQGYDQFMQNLARFMNERGLPLDLNPTVEGRPVNMFGLFQYVTKYKGYRYVTAGNGWAQVSQAMQFPPQQYPTAPQQIKGVYERNLLKFEEWWFTRRMQQQGMQGMPGAAPNNMTNMAQGGQPQKGMPQGQLGQMGQLQQAGQMMQPGQQAQMSPQGPLPQQPQPQGQTPSKPAMGQQQPQGINGFSTPQPQQPQVGVPPGHHRNSLSRSVQGTPTKDEFSMPSPAQRKSGSISLPGPAVTPGATAETKVAVPPVPKSDPEVYVPCAKEITSALEVKAVAAQGQTLEQLKPDVPRIHELGNVDIHALTRSLQSGIRSEMRVALDTLALVSAWPEPKMQPAIPVLLPHCDDLVETLIECAEDLVEVLAEDTVEVSDEILITSYEEVARACKLERDSLRNVPAAGSPEYDLDRSVDRLICVTTILRNLSFVPDNQKILADEDVIGFLCVVIRYLGTRNMLLRTQANTLDFMKDVIIFLSNVAHEMEIPGREQAFCLLQFLLAFAPAPPPTYINDRIFFTLYDPLAQPYLPAAVDSLAKLLARDEPNRTHYKAVLTGETLGSTSSAPYELLTRAFGLAISAVPEHFQDGRLATLTPLIEARKPTIMQGLLAADILASMIPSQETSIARSWLGCGNGCIQNLWFMVNSLCDVFEAQSRRAATAPQSRNQMPHKDENLVYIVSLAVSLVKRLSQKARDPNNPKGSGEIPLNALPTRGLVYKMTMLHAREWTQWGILAGVTSLLP